MSNHQNKSSILAQAALRLAPPMIREDLICDKGFANKYNFSTDATIQFRDFPFSFKRSVFFNSIREIHSGKFKTHLNDLLGNKCKLKSKTNSDFLVLSTHSGKSKIRIPNFAILSPSPAERLMSFNHSAHELRLPRNTREYWNSILSERSLNDDEIDEFITDIHDTPVHVERLIIQDIAAGQSSIPSLVPSSRRYYDRLVGSYDGSQTIHQYVSRVIKKFFHELSSIDPYQGFFYSLLLSSHSIITSEILVDTITKENLVHAFKCLSLNGDRLSQIGAIEIGLRVLPDNPEIESFLIQIIEQIRDDDVDNHLNGLKLFSALFVMVDGELSRLRLMPAEPPFYRRLAALAQASLIHRQLIKNNTFDNNFYEWALTIRGAQYYIQSFVDMRTEPRWNPDYATASQMKQDFFGRIIIAANTYDSNIKTNKVRDCILGLNSKSIISNSELLSPFFPGPLEGAEDTQHSLPIEISETIKKQVSNDKLDPSTFIALVNSAMIFQVEADHVKLALAALKTGNYHLTNIQSKSQLFTILNGLATVAANGRNRQLANELRIIVRMYRHDSQFKLTISEALRICIAAAASFINISEWVTFVGEFITELSFSEFENDDAFILYSQLNCLCHSSPKLWMSCSKAHAALEAYRESHRIF